MPETKETQESVDFPILKHVDSYLHSGGRIEKKHSLICLVDKDGDHIIGGTTTKEMLENLIFLIC
jgi:hypothetical protein